MRSKIYEWNDEDFRKIIEQAKSYKECAEIFGLSANGGNTRKQIQNRCAELGISCAHFQMIKSTTKTGSKSKYSYDEILIEHSPYDHASRLRDRLIKDGLLVEECAICHLSNIWNGLPLTLQLDHINGIHDDNRLENLRLLCPNCHSQTETFGGKNLRQRRAKAE